MQSLVLLVLLWLPAAVKAEWELRCSKHAEHSIKIGIINPSTRLYVVGSFCMIHTTMHGSTNIDELNVLYSSLNILQVIKSRRMRWLGHVERMGEGTGTYRVLMRKPGRNRPLGKLMRRWEDNIKMDLQELGCEDTDWIELAQDRERWREFVNAVMKLGVP